MSRLIGIYRFFVCQDYSYGPWATTIHCGSILPIFLFYIPCFPCGFRKKTTKTWVSYGIMIPAVPFHVHLPWGPLAGWLQELREPADEVPVAHPFGWSFSWHSAMVWSGVKATGTTGATGLWGSQRILNFQASNMSEDLINKNWDLDTFSDRYCMIGMLVYNWATFMDVSSMVRWVSWTTLDFFDPFLYFGALFFGLSFMGEYHTQPSSMGDAWRSNQNCQFLPRNDYMCNHVYICIIYIHTIVYT